jgi:hypothetical protein
LLPAVHGLHCCVLPAASPLHLQGCLLLLLLLLLLYLLLQHQAQR